MLSMLDDQTGAAADQIGAPAVQTEASADQAALVDDQTGAPVVQTEASEAGDDKPGAAVEHHGAIADQPVAAAEQTGAPDDETEAAPDQSEAFEVFLSKYACGAGGANNGTEALSEVKEIILIIWNIGTWSCYVFGFF